MFASKAYIKSYVYTGKYMVSGMIQTPIHGSVTQSLNTVDEPFLLLIGSHIEMVNDDICNVCGKLTGMTRALETQSMLPGQHSHMSPSSLCPTLSVTKARIHWLTLDASNEKTPSPGSTERYVAIILGEMCMVGKMRIRSDLSVHQFLSRTQHLQTFQELRDVSLYRATSYQQQTLTFAEEDCIDMFAGVILNMAKADLIYEVSKDALASVQTDSHHVATDSPSATR